MRARKGFAQLVWLERSTNCEMQLISCGGTTIPHEIEPILYVVVLLNFID